MRTVLFLLLPLLSAAVASAQGELAVSPIFTHDALSCMSTEDFPVLEASVDPAESSSLRKAQVYFKAARNSDWYFVEMEPGENSRLRAILPKPRPETDRVNYYVFFLTGSFGTSQSEEFSVHVSETGCKAIPGAAASAPASLMLHATVPNQLSVPAGFQAQGISGLVTTAGNTVSVGSAAAGGGAASGGVSAATIGIVAGGGAAAAAAVVATSGSASDGDNASADVSQEPADGITSTSSLPSPSPSPSPEPAPSPAPPPAPSVPDVSGTWHTTDRIIESCLPSLVGRISDTQSVIQQNGTRLTLSRSHEGYSENHTGTIDTAGRILLSGQFVDDGDSGTVRIEATTTTGSDMTGTRTHFYPAHNCTIRATFSGSKR